MEFALSAESTTNSVEPVGFRAAPLTVASPIPVLSPSCEAPFSPARNVSHRTILGVRFFVGSVNEGVEIGCRGGLVLAPSGPGMATLGSASPYREALHGADLILTDSSMMVSLWNILHHDRVPRISGLRFLRALLSNHRFLSSRKVLWVMPSQASMETNLRWLRANGHAVTRKDCYVAPDYGENFEDAELLHLINKRRPEHVMICVGGGVQEPLGWYLRRHCEFSPSIYCLGAAIGFLSGDQAPIPVVADRLGMGWLIRCLSSPTRFIPRYMQALRVFVLMWRFGGLDPVHSPR